MTAETRKVVLVDLSSLFWGAWHALGEKSPGEAFRATIDSVGRCAKEGDLLAICCDRGSAKRKQLLPTYKANRPEKDAVALEQLRLVKERLELDGRLLWGVEGYEADDIISAATSAAVERNHPVLVCSADKDLLYLLHKPGVEVMRTYNGWERWDAAKVREKSGIDPGQMVDWLALVGDTSDNIPGAPGVGPKTATALLQEFGDVDGIYQALAADPTKVCPVKAGGISKTAQALIDNEKQVRLALQLIALDQPPLAFDELYVRREQKPIAKEADMAGTVVEGIEDAQFEEPPKVQTSNKSEPAPAAKVEPVRETALAPAADFERGLEPRSSGDAWKLAGILYNSRLYSRFPNQEAILAVMLRGRELGFGAAKSLDVFHFVEGKVMPHAHLLVALAENHADCEYVQLIESTDKLATYETKHRRHPRPTRLTYTIEQAQAAGLAGRPIWKARAAEMLRKTCATQLVRIVFPSAALGLYALEEMGEE